MVLLMLCVSGAVVATPSTNITISLTTTPQPPTDFDITQTGTSTINITWTKGIGANITIVRGSTTGYPFSISDGADVYSGNGTYVEVGGLDLTNNTYYYRAWSQNAYGTSQGYAQGSIGAETPAVDLSGVIAYIANIMEGPMGLGNIMLIVALLGFAIWKKGWIRVILALCIVIWGVFAIDYDIKIAAPLLAIGSILFFEGIFREIRQRRTEAEEV